jgi:predicted AAA+ superfamily ATPase
MKPWFKNVTPHRDIREGHLDESIFAANLAEVASGTGREIYTSPEMFFQKTYFDVILNLVET